MYLEISLYFVADNAKLNNIEQNIRIFLNKVVLAMGDRREEVHEFAIYGTSYYSIKLRFNLEAYLGLIIQDKLHG